MEDRRVMSDAVLMLALDGMVAGEKFVSPYVGEAGGEKAFGGKLLGQTRLREKSTFLRWKKVGGK
jgi:hypothetical protein